MIRITMKDGGVIDLEPVTSELKGNIGVVSVNEFSRDVGKDVNGEIATAGMRKPIWPKSSLRSLLARASRTRGGRTWSKKPPHSS